MRPPSRVATQGPVSTPREAGPSSIRLNLAFPPADESLQEDRPMRDDTKAIIESLKTALERHGTEYAQKRVAIDALGNWGRSMSQEWLEELIAEVEALGLDASELRAARR